MYIINQNAYIGSNSKTSQIQITPVNLVATSDVSSNLGTTETISAEPIHYAYIEPEQTPLAEQPEPKYLEWIEFNIPDNQNGFKSWMPGSAITSKASPQYKLLQMATSDDNGLWKYNDDYLVALGSFYSTTIGDRFEITLSSGVVFTMVLGDQKSDAHTNSTHQVTSSNGCIMEFIVDMSKFKSTASYTTGDISSIGFEGTVVQIAKIGNIYTDQGLEPEPLIDTSRPIYEVYKNGYPVSVPAELQWRIRELCEQNGYPEKIVFGLILKESTFSSKASSHGTYGLAQITKYWLTAKPIEPYRLTDDYKSRDLLNPEHNLLTLMEIWNYAKDTYNLDPYNDGDMLKLLYWHNTGKDPRNVTRWKYATDIFGFADELVEIK